MATLCAMRMRGVAAAVAGVVGAATAHALDEYGALPGVHESPAVRGAMGLLPSIAWLILAGSLAWLAGRSRPVVLGAPSALVVSALPELVGRHDMGAIVEPGALTGAGLQWGLLLAVLAVLVVFDGSPEVSAAPQLIIRSWWRVTVSVATRVPLFVERCGGPRAPPGVVLSAHFN